MNLILNIPIEVRIACLFVFGALLGSLANWATYSLAWNRRPISPWSPPDPGAPKRIWFDRVPIFGWLTLQREAGLHGRGYWIRPLLIELATAFGLAWLYFWEVSQAGLLAPGTPRPVPVEWQGMLHVQFVVHALLIWLMLSASLIDLDEKTIPDSITVPGTLAGSLLMGFFPLAALPDQLVRLNAFAPPQMFAPANLWQIMAKNSELWRTMTFNAPCGQLGWPAGFPAVWPLAVALGCWLLWCFALLRRDWYTRHGLRRAMQLCMARLARDPSTVRIAILAMLGTGVIGGFWFAGGRAWLSLLSALIGMAAAGAMVWSIRIVGGVVLRREAMGFGDVTLMAMIGVYAGWQASVLIFFVAPLAAVVIGLVVLAICRDNVIPYGPFLCIATLFVVLDWAAVWEWAGPRFDPDWLVPGVLGGCLIMLAVLLGLLQIVKQLIFRR